MAENNQQRRGNYRGAGDEKEIESTTIELETKKISIDVRQNQRGMFMKIIEVGSRGTRNRLLMGMGTASEFSDELEEMIKHHDNLGAPSETPPEDPKLKSSMVTGGNKRYYVDLRENERGRFLRVSQTLPRGGPRSQIVIPADDMKTVLDSLRATLEKHGSDEPEEPELPESKGMRAENKMFYFDIGQNNRGTYMRISEVRNRYRSAVTFPSKAWANLRDIIDFYINESEGKDSPRGENSAREGAGDV